MESEFQFNRQGEPIQADEWLRLFADEDYKRIAKTKVEDSEVSTVWLGLSFCKPPKIFETMVFPITGDYNYRKLYTTEEDAYFGHEQAVEVLREAYRRFPEGP